jgi:hypothetical protein
MAVVSLNRFRTEPGRLADHLSASAEALEHLHRLGLQAFNLQAIAGGDVGTITTVVNYADNAEYAAALQRIQGDGKWQEFWARAAAEASAVQVESSLFTDVDASFRPNPDRPLGVILATQWRPVPGRGMDFMGNVMTSFGHIARLGGAARALQSVIGAHPMTVLVSVGFADLDAYGAYADATAGDEQWQAFWAGVLADPTADLIRSGLYVNISG